MVVPNLSGLRAAVIGVAREGTALTRFLALAGATVTLSDVKPAEQLSAALEDVQGLPIRLALGGHPADLLDVDVLFLSPGVPLSAPVVRQAQSLNIPISSEPRLFVQHFSRPVVGITGSSGKTTTTTLVGRMLAAAGLHAWVGGNIGTPLIGELAGDVLAELAVMELSSFQLELFRPETQGEQVELVRTERSRAISLDPWSPHIAVVTNITPNHLDRHSSMENYIWAKAAIVDYQKRGDYAVLNADDENALRFRGRTAGEVVLFSLSSPVDHGGYLHRGSLWLRMDRQDELLCASEDVRLKGEHNLSNILAAACAARLAGATLEAIRTVATEFEGVPHRMEVVRRWNGITFVNDSIATTPERAIAAIRAYDEPLVLLAGGRDKHLPWDRWAEWVRRKVRVVIAFGECASLVQEALAQSGDPGPALYQCDDLAGAVMLARELARAGDVVLLSPGGTSFDAFADFEARGLAFRRLVESL
jgi:UDP-N-acetylmuramoylalanine--D-glutamate ligase